MFHRLAIALVCATFFLACTGHGSAEDATGAKIIEYEKFAIEALRQSDYPSAIQFLDKIVEQNPAHPMALRLMGEAYLSMNRFDKAIDIFSDSIARDAGDLGDYYHLSVALEHAGRLEDAEDCLERAVAQIENTDLIVGSTRLSPNEVLIYSRYAMVLSQNGRVERAVSSLESGFQRNTASKELFILLEELLKRVGNEERRIELLTSYCEEPLLRDTTPCIQS